MLQFTKSLVFRVTRVAFRDKVTAAICASNALIGWPDDVLSETILAYATAASESNGSILELKSCANISDAAIVRSFFLRLVCSRAIPYKISASVIAVIKSDEIGLELTH